MKVRVTRKYRVKIRTRRAGNREKHKPCPINRTIIKSERRKSEENFGERDCLLFQTTVLK